MITQITDFKGKYKLSTGMYDTSKLQDYINRYEPRYLKELLGVDFYNQFIADLDANNLPESPLYLKIYNPLSEDISALGITQTGAPFNGILSTHYLYGFNSILDSEGIKEMLKGFIYFEYAKDLMNEMTPYGNVKQSAENSEVTGGVVTMIYTRYNEAIRTFQSIQEYILLNLSAVTGQIVTLDIVNQGTQYLNATNVPLTYATQQITDGGLGLISVQLAGSNYSIAGTDVPLLNGTGIGATVDYIGDGAGGILSVTINQRGSGYTIGDVLIVNDGDINAEIYVDDLFYTTEYISEVTGSNATADIVATPIGEIDGQFLSVAGEGFSDGEYMASGGSGAGAVFSVTVDPLDPLQAVFTLDLVDGGLGYIVGETIYLGSTVDAEITVTSVTDGMITDIVVNQYGQEYKEGDLLTIAGGDGTAQFEVTKIGLGYDKFKGVRKSTAYWL
jgi:hypothetical protein